MTAQTHTPGSLPKSGCLHGVRVLEVGGFEVEFAGRILSGNDADVVKVEPPVGERTRRLGPFYHDIPDLNRSLHFWHYNVGKRSLTLDLDTRDGQELFRRLAHTADVVLDGRPAGYLEARHLGLTVLRATKPDLIFARVTPFGRSGPWASYPANDLVQLALGGQMMVCGYAPPESPDEPDTPPLAADAGQSSHMAGLWTAIGIVSALLARKRDGVGQALDVAVHDACSVTTEVQFPRWEYERTDYRRGGHQVRGTGNPLLLCRDGLNLCVLPSFLGEDKWQDLKDWLKAHDAQGDLEGDAYGSVEVLSDPSARAHLFDVLELLAARMTAAEMVAGLQSAGIACAPVFAPEDLLQDPQAAARGVFEPVEHEELGERFRYIGGSFVNETAPWQLRRRPPLLGEHTREILLSELGLRSDQHELLFQLGIV
jgi:crotonobetainyl-CoA:carnitine CoA-transferase CaiB-like acyl-CoA transferase